LRRLGRPKVASRTETVALHRAAPSTGSLEGSSRAAVREEMAVHLTDAVLRRLDLGTAGPPAADEVGTVLAVMASAHGWDEAARRRETAALDAFYAERRL
jgi:glycerol-3-phosphate dehydrogenase